jgi:hypothetical protein
MINKEFLANCSDEQINAGVAWAKCSDRFLGGAFFDGNYCPRRYCIRPKDIMPIAFANNIALIPLSDNDNEIGMSTFNGDWKAVANESNDREFGFDCKFYESISDNPLRAICEVYILMSVAK